MNYFGMTKWKFSPKCYVKELIHLEFCGFFNINKCESQFYFFFGIYELASRAFLTLD